MLDNLHDLASKCYFLHVKIYSLLAANHECPLCEQRTILRSYLSEHNIPLLVDLEISDAITLPLLENRYDLMSSSAIRDRKADRFRNRFDVKQCGEPISSRYDLPAFWVFVI